jgi:hypothetical protein
VTTFTQLNKETAGLEFDDLPSDALISFESRTRGSGKVNQDALGAAVTLPADTDTGQGARSIAGAVREKGVSILDWTTVDTTGDNECTSELQAAAAQALAAKLPLLIPPGVYSIEDEIDLRNVGSTDARVGIVGMGRGKSIIQRVNADGPILRTGGRYTEVRGLTVKFAPYSEEDETDASCITCEDSCFFNIYDDLLIIGGFRGMYSFHTSGGTPSFFSNTVANIRAYDHLKYGMDLTPSTGNVFSNWHISAGVRQRVWGLVRVRNAFQGDFLQINCEHALCMDRPLLFDNCLEVTAKVHFEKVSLLGGGTTFDGLTSRSGFVGVSGRGIGRITNMQVDSCFVGGQKIVEIAQTGGVATARIDVFDSEELNNVGHGLKVGDTVTVAGFAEAAYNGAHTVTAISVSDEATLAGETARYDEFSFAVDGGTSSPGTLPSGTDHGTVVLGTTTNAVLIDNPSGCEDWFVEVLHARDTTVIGTTSSVRASGLVPVRDSDADASGRVYFEKINTQGEMVRAWASAALNIVAVSRDTTHATIYTKEKHFFRVGDPLCIPSATNSGYSSATPYTVSHVINQHTFKVANTTGTSALAKEATGTVLPGTYTITHRAKTGGMVTLTIGTHSLKVGMRIQTRCNGTGYTDSETVIQSVTSTTISYRTTDTDTETTAAALGVVLFLSFGVSVSTLHDPSSTGKALKKWGHMFEAVACLDFTAVNADATASGTVTITGAKAGVDSAELRLLSAPDDGLIIHRPVVTADNTITVKATNASGANIADSTPVIAMLQLVRE